MRSAPSSRRIPTGSGRLFIQWPIASALRRTNRQGFATLQDLFGRRPLVGTSAQAPAARAGPVPAIAAADKTATTTVARRKLHPAVRLLFDMSVAPADCS